MYQAGKYLYAFRSLTYPSRPLRSLRLVKIISRSLLPEGEMVIWQDYEIGMKVPLLKGDKGDDKFKMEPIWKPFRINSSRSNAEYRNEITNLSLVQSIAVEGDRNFE